MSKYQNKSETNGGKLHHITLKKGDVLYIPSYFCHYISAASDHASVSLSIWLQSYANEVFTVIKSTQIPYSVSSNRYIYERIDGILYIIRRIEGRLTGT